jgi:hypothetical protein
MVSMELLPAEVSDPQHLTACPFVKVGEVEPAAHAPAAATNGEV